MDPIQAIAANQVSNSCKSGAEQIDSFYEEHAFETLHSVRCAFGRIAVLVRAKSDMFRGAFRRVPQFASAR